MTTTSMMHSLLYTAVLMLTQLSSSSSAFMVTKNTRNAFSFRSSTTTSPSSLLKVSPTDTSTNSGDADEALGSLEKVLQKRLEEGSGALSKTETSSAVESIEVILDHLLDQEEESSPPPPPPPTYEYEDLHVAATQLDVDAVSTMLKSGLQMNAQTTDAAFWAVINAIDDAEEQDLALSTNITNMIHHIFDADRQLLMTREKISTNLTCMQPDDGTGIEGSARKMNYVFDDSSHRDLPLMEGRRCEDGNCCDKCSRNIFPTFATDIESDLHKFPGIETITFNELEKLSAATIVQFVRLIERVRRTIAYEYGLPLSTVLPLQAYSRKYVAGTTQQGGGGGEGDFVTLHTDEATHAGYHYSCVLYLSTQGEDFEGGNFVFNDPEELTEEEKAADAAKAADADAAALESKNAQQQQAQVDDDDDDDDDGHADALMQAFLRGEELPDSDFDIVEAVTTDSTDDIDDDEDADNDQISGYYETLEDEIRRSGRVLTPFHPKRGAGVIFSSGWENMHEVEKITSGIRYAVPCFFTTCLVPEIAYDQMKVGKPTSDEDIADDWLHLLLAHRKESPTESVGRVKELLMKWHYLCAPLSQH